MEFTVTLEKGRRPDLTEKIGEKLKQRVHREDVGGGKCVFTVDGMTRAQQSEVLELLDGIPNSLEQDEDSR